ncbi:uncharacterized protein PGTG_09258 [Puccinia graminis f. sp. tritici CRL 75-36-700-3]|uniref:Uncharacterized protein n=1 Tax=Puccinia graminis f. sp. tritici (strain CRL 75-36-700-3 / race SCCL) TaxID=418459 RepID=E3KG46_PUCGT|nr:uncharacterized protein PGTG_09258 [Puccinia graminis f. sp. tritici CRL 75-36-700-3]EFP83305.2 hypothetical protein PGTG_09258 [Puccinia graminis f. sp. tritici CRL 75-36-700-3]
MTSSKIPFFLVALCTLGGSQIPLSKGMEVKGLGKYLADNRVPPHRTDTRNLNSGLRKNIPVPGLRGHDNLVVRNQEGSNAELIPENQDVISRSKNKEIDHRINALKLDHALRAVAVHLDELRNYIEPIEETVGAEITEPENVAESPLKFIPLSRKP